MQLNDPTIWAISQLAFPTLSKILIVVEQFSEPHKPAHTQKVTCGNYL